MDIPLRFVNQSESGSANVVVFQKNMSSDSDLAIAWQVFANSAPGSIYPFVYSNAVQAGASDSFGNALPMISAQNGQLLQVSLTSLGGAALSYFAPAASEKDIEIINNLLGGAIDTGIYRNGALLAIQTGVPPQQKAVFQFKPTIYIGVVPPLTQGEVMSSEIVENVITQISLLNIASADIVLTGGGVGTSATLFTFNLANIVFSEM